jgi:hypothetical protein
MAENTKAALDEKILECLALLKKLDNESGTLEAVSYLIRRPDPPLDIDKLVDKAMAEGDRVRPFSDALVLALKSLLDLGRV